MASLVSVYTLKTMVYRGNWIPNNPDVSMAITIFITYQLARDERMAAGRPKQTSEHLIRHDQSIFLSLPTVITVYLVCIWSSQYWSMTLDKFGLSSEKEQTNYDKRNTAHHGGVAIHDWSCEWT